MTTFGQYGDNIGDIIGQYSDIHFFNMSNIFQNLKRKKRKIVINLNQTRGRYSHICLIYKGPIKNYFAYGWS